MPVQDDNTVSLQEDLNLLNADAPTGDEEEVVTPPAEGADETEETSEEEPTEETSEEDETEEKPEEAPLPGRPTIKALNKEFPELLKKYPSLRDTIFREQEYTKIFPVVEDAKEAAANSQTLQDLREPALNGDLAPILNAVKEADPQALTKIAASIMPTLQKISSDLYWQASMPLMENLVRAVYRHGAQMGTGEAADNFKNSALHVANFLFGDDARDVLSGKKSSVPESTKEDDPLKQERENFQKERYNAFYDDVNSSITQGVMNLIMERGQHNKLKIDPDGRMSEWMQKNVASAVLNEVNKQLAADPTHMATMKSLWKRAKDAGYRGDWKSRILTAYLERVKSLVPAIRTRLVSEALGSSSVAQQPNGGRKAPVKRLEPGTNGKPSGQRSTVYKPSEVDYRKSSDLDIIMGTAKTRG